jgi:hypothetical protein
MLPGQFLLDNGGEAEAQRNMVIKFFLILDHMRQRSNLEPGAASALETASQLNGTAVAKNTTAFLYCAIHHLHHAMEEKGDCPSDLLQLFHAHLFDVFFPMLKNGDAVEIPGVSPNVVVLPRMGIRIQLTEQNCRLARVNADEILLAGSKSEVRIQLSQPGENTLPKFPVSDSAVLLLSTEGLIKDDLAEQKIAHGLDAGSLADEIRKALTLIGMADSSLAAAINKGVPWYFPIETPDKRQVHNSFSIATVHGSIFLSESYSYLALAEALVHEFYHNQLWWAMSIESHINERDEPRLYSPWRNDPRPLIGLYHGIYVFTGLLEFFKAGENNPNLRNHRSHFRARRENIYFQLRTAISQVPEPNLEPQGKAFLKALSEIVGQHGIELGLQSSGIPEPQKGHWQQWTSRNTDYRRFAVSPPGLT